MKIALFNRPSTSKTPAGTLEERVQLLEANIRTLSLEWEDTYERIMRALRRLNKRAQDQKERDAKEDENAQEAPGATIPEYPGVDPISAKILARRARVSPRSDGSHG